MGNGFSVEEMLERIEKKLESVENKLDDVVSHGCAQRPNDISRIDKLESWRDRTVFGIISVFVMVIIDFLRGR